MLRELSPLTHAARISAPLLLVHGRRDVRVPLDQALQLRRAVLSCAGRQCDLHVYEGGHAMRAAGEVGSAHDVIFSFLGEALGAEQQLPSSTSPAQVVAGPSVSRGENV